MRLRDLISEGKMDIAELDKKEAKAISKVKSITVSFAPAVAIDGEGVLKPKYDKSDNDWTVTLDKSKLPKGAKENRVRQVGENLFWLWLDDTVKGKRSKTESEKIFGDLKYTAKINFK